MMILRYAGHLPVSYSVSVLASSLLACLSTSNAFAANAFAAATDSALTLNTVNVSATQDNDAARALHQLPGASNLIEAEQVRQGRVAGVHDLLAYQPGIYAQSPGNEGAKVSIRGSGINRGPGAHASGVYVTLDGLPLTGPGGTPYELLEPLWLSRAEVLRGANGLERGALALGGSINYVSRNGVDSPGLELHYEAGSHGYRKHSLGYGGVQQDLDYYLTYTGSEYDGYQRHAAGDAKGVAANIGWRITPALETRMYLRYRETNHLTPGRLTREQIRNSPRDANPSNLALDARRPQPGSTWIGNTTTVQLDADSTLQTGLVYHRYPMDLNESMYRQQIDYADLNATVDYRRRHLLWERESATTIGLRVAHDLSADVRESLRFERNGYPAGTPTRNYIHRGTHAVLHLGNELQLSKDLRLTSGLALIQSRYKARVTQPANDNNLSGHDEDYAPRLGLTWQASPAVQLFGNLSRSVEPAHPWSMMWGSNSTFAAGYGAASGRQNAALKLENQTASTLEVGARGDAALGHWELTGYWSEVRHELLSVEVPADSGNYVTESNASPTLHRGIEASLDSTLWQGPLGRLTLRQAYTFSDFRFRHDEHFGDNVLPGLPRSYYQGELRYAHPSGVYAAINSEYASKMAVDYANSYYADSHLIFGTRLGYDAPGNRWQGWLELRNLTDRHYAATVTPGYDDAGQDRARSTPGEGFGIYAGMSWRFL
jgi:iron complex outermembrane receptor protein